MAPISTTIEHLETMLRPHTGYHWCEYNYAHSPYIAEFYNTISNLTIVMLPAVLMYFGSEYVLNRKRSALISYALISWIGLSSMIYHATVSLFGQLLDELAILWASASIIVVALPDLKILPPAIKKNSGKVQFILTVLVVMMSALCFYKPSANAFVLWFFPFSFTLMIHLEAQRIENQELNVMIRQGAILVGVGYTLWMIERLWCPLLRFVHFPYFHAIFHVLLATAGYCAGSALLYINVHNTAPEYKVSMKRWPRKTPYHELLSLYYVNLKPIGAQL